MCERVIRPNVFFRCSRACIRWPACCAVNQSTFPLACCVYFADPDRQPYRVFCAQLVSSYSRSCRDSEYGQEQSNFGILEQVLNILRPDNHEQQFEACSRHVLACIVPVSKPTLVDILLGRRLCGPIRTHGVFMREGIVQQNTMDSVCSVCR